MAVQIVMDPTGDRRHEFTTGDATAVAKAERRFKQLKDRLFGGGIKIANALRVTLGGAYRCRKAGPG